MNTARTLQETLETEYPLLDSSLVAALLTDFPSDADSSHESFKSLRHTLAQLSLDAQTEPDPSAPSDLLEYSKAGSSGPLGSEKSATFSNPDNVSSATSGVSSASTSATSALTHASALDFLQTLFPQLSRAILSQAIHDCCNQQESTDEPDLSAVVDHLLTLEHIQDLTERGLMEDEPGGWSTVRARGKHQNAKQNRKARRHTIPVIDTLQRQHVPRAAAADIASPSPPLLANPWIRLNSLATCLSELLKPTTPGYFMSYFHSPVTQAPNGKLGCKGEGDAVRAALSNLAGRATKPVDEASINVVHEILFDPEAYDLVLSNVEERARLEADVRLCVTVAGGDSATAIDLVWLLRELDDALTQGHGVKHVVQGAVSSTSRQVTASATMPPPTQPWTFGLPSPILPPSLSQKLPPQETHVAEGWTLVEPRRPTPKTLHPYAQFIPAYDNRNLRARRPLRGSGNQFGKGGKGDVGELKVNSAAWYREREYEIQMQRAEVLREATRHWQSGNAKSRGGETALYYAEKARELQEERKRIALNAARVMVTERRTTSSYLDLHDLTIAEACVIVTEALAATPPTLERPLEIVTGRGVHSVGRVGVLGPAIHEMLRSEGWSVSVWDGGLLVRGRV